MKKIVKSTVLISTIASSLMAYTKVNPKIFDKYPEITNKVEILKAIDLGNVYEVLAIPKSRVKGAYTMFITKDKRYIIFGQGYDLKTNKPLKIAVDIAKYKNKAAFTFGTGKDEYYLFTDPECPFCKQFEKVMAEMKNKVKIHVFFFPLSFHPHSKAMSLYILSQPKNKRYEAMKSIMLDNSTAYENFSPTKEAKDLLKEHMEIANEVSVSGTPTVFDAKGNTISWVDLAKKYKIQMPIDTKAISFLKQNNVPVKLNDNHKKDIYVFLDLENNKNFINSKKFKNLMSKYNVNVIFFPKDSQVGFAKALLVYASKNPKDAFFKYAKKDITEKEKKESAEYLKDQNISKKIMSGLFVSDKLNIIKTPLIVDDNGEIIK